MGGQVAFGCLHTAVQWKETQLLRGVPCLGLLLHHIIAIQRNLQRSLTYLVKSNTTNLSNKISDKLCLYLFCHCPPVVIAPNYCHNFWAWIPKKLKCPPESILPPCCCFSSRRLSVGDSRLLHSLWLPTPKAAEEYEIIRQSTQQKDFSEKIKSGTGHWFDVA